MNECNFKQMVLHATSLQTLLKVIENQYNNLPLGYHYHQDQDNTAILKILTPNMIRVGRINSRSLDGPVRLPSKYKEQVAAVEKVYDSWFKVWKESYLPKLLCQPKWFKSDEDLKNGDLVYFSKSESSLSNDYTMGRVDQVITGKDGKIRRVIVKYFNGTDPHPKLTDRAVRSLIKIFSIDELCLAEDLAILQKRLDQNSSRNGHDSQSNISVHDEILINSVVNSRREKLVPLSFNDNGLPIDLKKWALTNFPSACTIPDLDFPQHNEDDDQQIIDSQILEVDSMDKLSRTIMSVNMDLD